MLSVKTLNAQNLSIICPHTDLIPHTLGKVCQNCGLVFEELNLETDYIPFKTQDDKIKSSSSYRHYKEKNLDKLIKWEIGLKNRDNFNKKLRLDIIKLYLSKLDVSLNPNTIYSVVLKYRKWMKKQNNKIVFFWNNTIAAVIYFLMEQKYLYIDMNEIRNVFDLDLFTIYKTYHHIMKFYNIKPNRCEKIKQYLFRTVIDLKFPISTFYDCLYLLEKKNLNFQCSVKHAGNFLILLTYFSDIKNKPFMTGVSSIAKSLKFTFKYDVNYIVQFRVKYKIPLFKYTDFYQLHKYRNKLFGDCYV